MLKNYLITALRNLLRAKNTTLINVFGLTLGITAGLILFFLIKHQTSFDQFHTQADRIYRVVMEADGHQGKNYTSGVPPVLWEAFKNDFHEAEEVTFTSYRYDGMISVPQKDGTSKKFGDHNGIVFTTPSFFKIFDRPILLGKSDNNLENPNEVVLSKKAALNYFGKQDALGEVISFEGKEYKVTAIAENVLANTDFPFDVMLSYVTIKKERDEYGWNGIWSDEQCYFLLKKGTSIEEVERRLPAFYTKYHPDNQDHATYHTQLLASIHHDDRYNNYNYTTISREKITAMLVIAIFLIVTACINFINLVTAEAIKRSKEVGIRKTLGSSRGQLIVQFLGESALVTVTSVILAVAFAKMVLPSVNTFLKTEITIDLLHDVQASFFLLIITLLVSILSGLYPAFVVSGFKPVFAMKNGMGNKNSSGYTLRKSLVVLQFVISQFLIIATLVMVQQMNFLNRKDLGFNKEAVVNFPIPENAREGFSDGTSKMKTLREEVQKISGVDQVSLNLAPPSSGTVSVTGFTIEGKPDQFDAHIKLADGHYLGLYGLKLIAGKNIQDLDTAQGFLVNERMAHMLGYAHAQDIIGLQMKRGGTNAFKPVVGVVQDFHTMSLHEPIEPTVIFNHVRMYSNLSVKVNLSRFSETVKPIQRMWEAAYPAHIFSYKFLEEEIKEFYENDQRMSTMIIVFTSVAIFIGCLGLFGLATFMASQKTKEVGVRKVLGASVESIVLLFSKEYVKLIITGFVLSLPLAWYVMSQWLSTFNYRIGLNAYTFLVGFGMTFAIALLTVGYRSVKAATANPVHSLKSE